VSPTDPLRRVEGKLTRAKSENERLGRETTESLSRRPDEFYRLVPEFDLDASECRLRVKKVAEPPLEQWEPVLGEIIHSLRSALDLLAYQLAMLHKPDEPPPPGTEFPIFIDPEQFGANRKGSGAYKIRGLSETARTAIEALQPYGSPYHPLWVLQQLSNGDKHRLGVLIVSDIAHPIVNGPRWTNAVELSSRWERGPYKDGVVIARYRLRFTGGEPGVQVEFRPTLPISVDEGVGREPRLLALVMPDLLRAVDEIVGVFRPEFK
jgi:hypothetical protein